ncbi:PREDICTED: zinc finger protein 775-like [Dinoponera quadriceps]|uniref:Zinc finger protein 775-like n=1 Tax=Dinoponera quadriceps TaxID=609295 RepID=A0A6P3XVW2_DINQU|nr:PREDICTED: zinc finger protein 775-like [Dinoponera quadriceps]
MKVRTAVKYGPGGTEDQSLQCSACGKKYSLKHNLVRHVRFECGGQRRFSCHLCPNKYTQNVSLHRHLMHHHKIDVPVKRRYNAPRKMYLEVPLHLPAVRAQLHDALQSTQTHEVGVRRETGVLVQPLQLQFHPENELATAPLGGMIWTTGQLGPPRKSRHASYLKDEDLTLKCPQCGRGYKVKPSLSKHLRYECGGRRNFCCDLCGRSFTQNVSLRRHLMQNHNFYQPPKKQCVRKIIN